MGIDNTEKLLNKFDYKFSRKNNKLIIKMGLSQRMMIDFSNPEKIVISDKLVNWNFLTGIIEMSIKNAVLYNFIGVLFVTFLFIYLDLESVKINLMFFYLWLIFWVLLWTLFYFIKSENLKQVLMRWNEK